ncbi:hypothetical protein DIPPA_05893 [Diplonema papillatum]|nr:hypothetical protein DIPPA_05893 [Diplonema papillatum]
MQRLTDFARKAAAQNSSSMLQKLLSMKPVSEAEHRQSVLLMYRQMLRELAVWPSIKRARVRHETRRMFRVNAALTDKKDIEDAVQMGKNGLQSLVDQNNGLARVNFARDGINYTIRGPY